MTADRVAPSSLDALFAWRAEDPSSRAVWIAENYGREGVRSLTIEAQVRESPLDDISFVEESGFDAQAVAGRVMERIAAVWPAKAGVAG